MGTFSGAGFVRDQEKRRTTGDTLGKEIEDDLTVMLVEVAGRLVRQD